MKKLFLSAVVAGVMAYHGVTSAKAAFVIDINQVGSNVVATGSGTIDLTDLTNASSSSSSAAEIAPVLGLITMTSTQFDIYNTFTGPGSFGSGGATFANMSSGSAFTLEPNVDVIGVPHLYVSGSALSDSATYNSTTLTMLGLTPGTYVWNWGSGAHADNVTLQIGPVVTPLPTALPLFASGLVGLGLLGWRRKKSAAG